MDNYLTDKRLLLTFSLVVLLVCIVFGFQEKHLPMTITGLAFALLIILAYRHEIKTIKAGKEGIEATMRDANEVVQKGRATIEQMQRLAQLMASVTLGLVQRAGRLGGYSDEREQEIKENTVRYLKDIGIQDGQIGRMLDEEWHIFVEFDYAHFILGSGTVPKTSSSEIIREWKQLRSELKNIPSPEQLSNFLDKHGYLTNQRKELIKDFAYYKTHRAHRRPDVWAERQHWGRLGE